ncbi:Uncharacterised protein [Serratia marcescens]|nr:Uncharacterised protein [Serratia marcescens]
MVQINGSHPLVLEQKPAIMSDSAVTGAADQANSVPEVPRLRVRVPASMLPEPMAAIMLSPPPVETRTAGPRPSFSAAAGRTVPMQHSALLSGGRACHRRPLSSMRSTAVLLQRRVRTSNNPVPEASPYSATRSPVSQKFK